MCSPLSINFDTLEHSEHHSPFKKSFGYLLFIQLSTVCMSRMRLIRMCYDHRVYQSAYNGLSFVFYCHSSLNGMLCTLEKTHLHNDIGSWYSPWKHCLIRNSRSNLLHVCVSSQLDPLYSCIVCVIKYLQCSSCHLLFPLLF